MREKLETLPLAQLRELAKSQGLKGASGLRKAELIELLCKEAEKSGEGTEEKRSEDRNQEERRQAEKKPEEKRPEERKNEERKRYEKIPEGGQGENKVIREIPSLTLSPDLQELDSGIDAEGILEVMPDGFGFIRCENYLPGEDDVYVAPSQIRRFNMKTGDVVRGSRRVRNVTEKFAALLYIKRLMAIRHIWLKNGRISKT